MNIGQVLAGSCTCCLSREGEEGRWEEGSLCSLIFHHE